MPCVVAGAVVLFLLGVRNAAAEACFEIDAQPFPKTCAWSGAEILAAPAFKTQAVLATTSTPWRRWEATAGSMGFSADGISGSATLTIPASPLQEVWHAQLIQDVSLASGESYELCVRASSTLPGGTMQLSVDAGEPTYASAGGAPRAWLSLPSAGVTGVACFPFALPAGGASYSGRAVLDLGWSLGELSVCEVSLTQCGPSVPSPVPKPAPACTGAAADPWASGSLVECCAGLEPCLAEWNGDGRHWYRCLASCSAPL